MHNDVHYMCKRISKKREINLVWVVKEGTLGKVVGSVTWKTIDKRKRGGERFQAGRLEWPEACIICSGLIDSLPYWNRLPYMNVGPRIGHIPSNPPNLIFIPVFFRHQSWIESCKSVIWGLRPHLFHLCDPSAEHIEVFSECWWNEETLQNAGIGISQCRIGISQCRLPEKWPLIPAWTDLLIWRFLLPQSIPLWNSWYLESLSK